MFELSLAGKFSAVLSSSGFTVWAITGASVAEAMGLAIGLIGAAYAVAAFLKDKQLQLLESDNRFVTAAYKRVQEEKINLMQEVTHYRNKAEEYELKLRQSVLTAADMMERYRETREIREASPQQDPDDMPPPGSAR